MLQGQGNEANKVLDKLEQGNKKAAARANAELLLNAGDESSQIDIHQIVTLYLLLM